MLGAFEANEREPNEEEFEMISTFKAAAEARANKEYEFFIPIVLKTQVVSGMNYMVKV
jgi:hypothetical protein